MDSVCGVLSGNSFESIVARFETFASTTDIGPACNAFTELLAVLGGEGPVYARVRSALGSEPRWQSLFEKLDAQLASRVQALDAPVLVLGAGPCGLCAAVEAALCGLRVCIVEKRGEASRANVLTLWEETHAWLVLLGARELYPSLGEVPELYIATRELQLILLKLALLLGARVRLGAEVVGLVPPKADGMWCARIRPDTAAKAPGSATAAALGFKADKTADYVTSVGCCNRIDPAEVDPTFFSAQQSGEELELFSALILAEGDRSNTTRKLGFVKSVDTFQTSIGVIINMRYDRESEAEAALQSFAANSNVNKGFEVGGSAGTAKAHAIIQEMCGRGLAVECFEYLKGESHYIACCVQKTALLNAGVLRTKASGPQMLAAENVDMDRLREFARTCCDAVGLPASCAPHEHNPVQLFDFSSRARCLEPCRLLQHDGIVGLGEEGAEEQARAVVFPIGDALLEPFWPQGLGINRGFHASANAVHCARLFAGGQAAACVEEALFAYRCLTFGAWLPGFHARRFIPRHLAPAEGWSTDPVTRLHADVLREVAADCRSKAEGGKAGIMDRVPARFAVLAEGHVQPWENWQ